MNPVNPSATASGSNAAAGPSSVTSAGSSNHSGKQSVSALSSGAPVDIGGADVTPESSTAMDIDSHPFSSIGSTVDPDRQLLQLKENLNQLMVQVTLASAKVSATNGAARQSAVCELESLSKSVEKLVVVRDCLLASNATERRLRPSPASSASVVCPNNLPARYGLSVLDDRQRCASDLMAMVLVPGESIESFVDRFNDLRRRSHDQVPQSFLLVTRFMNALPPSLKEKVNLTRHSRGINEDISVDKIIQITRDLVGSMSPAEVADMMVSKLSPPAVVSGSSASKWASKPLSEKAIPVQGASLSRVSKAVSKKKTCKYHEGRPHNHDTSECKSFQGNARVAAGNAAPKGDKAQYIMSLKEARETDRCRTCGWNNFSRGPHDCPGASTTAVRTGPPPSSSLHRFGMMDLVPGSSAAGSDATSSTPETGRYCDFHGRNTHGNQDCKVLQKVSAMGFTRAASSSSSSASSSAAPSATSGLPLEASQADSAAATLNDNIDKLSVHDDAMDIDQMVAIEAQKCKINEYSNLPVNKSNSLLIPLIVEQVKVYGVLDTGCTFSICAPQFAESLGVAINYAVDGNVQLGHTSTLQPRIGTCYLKVFYNKRSFTHKFEIFDFFTESNDCPILLGLDIMSDLKIGITGLTSSWFEYTGPELPSPIDPDCEPNNDPYGTPFEREQAFKPIEALLKENAAIDLASTYCNLPGAIVKLETIPGKIAYRAPYPVPVVYKDAVLAQLAQWEKEGVIEPSPSHNGWNHPLLVVAKKNSAGEYSFDKPRIVADVRLLNQILVSTDRYQMPRIDEIHQKFSAATITSCIDSILNTATSYQ
ncbi:hypothetical protein BD408DRAFT_407654 [Parasitella parasitica]|nr:hypothetical protein BD408DRAFT_407654 [Parasitella parasitica]